MKRWLFLLHKIYVVAVPVLGRGNAGVLLKGTVKVCCVTVTALDGNVQNVHGTLGFIQHPLGFFDPLCGDIVPEFYVKRLFKKLGKIVGGNTTRRRD